MGNRRFNGSVIGNSLGNNTLPGFGLSGLGGSLASYFVNSTTNQETTGGVRPATSNPSFTGETIQPPRTKSAGSRLYQAATAGLMGNTAGVKPTGAPMPFNPNQQNTIKGVFGSQVPGTFDMDINPNLGNINL